MKISVITVSRNSASTIGRTLESFAGQQHPDRELIVIDGASTDGTQAIVDSFASDQIRLVSEPDAGIYDAMNKGLAVFSGDAVGFLNSDDCFKDHGTLSAIAARLEEAEIVHGSLDFVARDDRTKVVRRWRGTAFRKRAFGSGWMPPHPTFYIRRAVVDAVGRFDVGYRIAADYDFMLRALELHDFRATLIDRVLVEMTHGGESTKGLKAYLISNYEAHRSRRTWLDAGIADPALLAKPLRKVGQLVPEWINS
jgi:glycosyltransferase involved in cell wall biosynthesis